MCGGGGVVEGWLDVNVQSIQGPCCQASRDILPFSSPIWNILERNEK